MGRTRHQEGTVKITGKQKVWTGFYYIYDQAGERHRTSANLGPSKGVTKWQAKQKLRAVIETTTGQAVETTGEDTLEWYYWHRYSNTRTWEKSTRRLVDGAFKLHILPRIGSTKLQALDKYQIVFMFDKLLGLSQSYLNTMKTFLKTVLDYAVEDNLIVKNPFPKKHKIETASTVPVAERKLTEDELGRFFAELDFRDRLICRIAVVVGLRAGEIVALRWDRYDPQQHTLLIDQSFVKGELKTPKTKASIAKAFLPEHLAQELEKWRELAPPGELMFTSAKGKMLSSDYFRQYIMARAAIAAGIVPPRPEGFPKGATWVKKEEAVNFQAMRRTCATLSSKTGSVKTVQTILRHAPGNATVALKHYIKPIDSEVQATMSNLDAALSAIIDLPTTALTM